VGEDRHSLKHGRFQPETCANPLVRAGLMPLGFKFHRYPARHWYLVLGHFSF
jgi:hypothetical protein